MRHAFSKFGGNLGTDGSVAYLFNKQGHITFAPGADEDAIMEVALEAGADDVVANGDDSIDVITTLEDFAAVNEALQSAELASVNAEVTMHPATSVKLDVATGEKVVKLLDMLEELDDVQNVYHNAIIPAEAYGQ